MESKQMEISQEFPKRLKVLRQKLGWSQGQVAKKVQADPQRISKYENGVIFPTTDMLIKLSQIFEVSLDYLVLGEKEIDTEEIKNRELLKRVQQIDQLSEEEQNALILVMDTFIRKSRLDNAFESAI